MKNKLFALMFTSEELEEKSALMIFYHTTQKEIDYLQMLEMMKVNMLDSTRKSLQKLWGILNQFKEQLLENYLNLL